MSRFDRPLPASEHEMLHDGAHFETLLPPTRKDPRALFRPKAYGRGYAFVLGVQSEGGIEYWPIEGVEAARLYLGRGLVPPEELAHLLIIDERPSPWTLPGSRSWRSMDIHGYGDPEQILHETPGGRYVVERLDETDPDRRFEGLRGPSDASEWLGAYGSGTEADAVDARLRGEGDAASKAQPEPFTLRVMENPIPTDDGGESRPIHPPGRPIDLENHPPSPESLLRAGTAPRQGGGGWEQKMPRRARLALASYLKGLKMMDWAQSHSDIDIYNFIIDNDGFMSDYVKGLKFETWTRNLRHGRNALGMQKNRSLRGRDHGQSVVPLRKVA